MNPTSSIMSQHRQQQGLSLVELMVAMTLGLFLIWGVTQSFLTSRQVYDMQGALSQIQENTRLAQEFIAFDIRNAGDYGCASGDKFLTGAADVRMDANCTAGTPLNGTTGFNMLASTAATLDDEYQYAVYGFNNVTSATLAIGGLSATLSPAPKNNTDVLMVHTASEIGTLAGALPCCGAGNEPPTKTTIATLAIPGSAGNGGTTAILQPTDRIAVSDCATTKIFAIDATAEIPLHTTSLTLDTTDNYCRVAAFAQGASIRKLTTIYYYVATQNGRTSLYRALGTGGTADELLEGVEDLQLEFGIDNDSHVNTDINVYKDWSTGNIPSDPELNSWDWFDDPVPTNNDRPEANVVRAVRYHLLMSAGGSNLMADDQQRLMFFGTEYVGGVPLSATTGRDKKLRQVVTGTVGIRSRGL